MQRGGRAPSKNPRHRPPGREKGGPPPSDPPATSADPGPHNKTSWNTLATLAMTRKTSNRANKDPAHMKAAANVPTANTAFKKVPQTHATLTSETLDRSTILTYGPFNSTSS